MIPSHMWFAITEPELGVFVIEEPFHDERVKSCLIVGEARAILLDTGMGVADIREVVDRLTDLPILVVNSHAHWDHIGDNHRFEEIWIHEAESDALQSGVGNAVLRRWFQPVHLTGPLPDGVSADTINIPPSTPTGTVRDGQVIDTGARLLEVWHCPGHSPGGIVLVDHASGALFSTDVAYAGALYVYGAADLPVYQRSLHRLAALAPDLKAVYPSHGESPISPRMLPRMAE
ncbi:MAG TPA: MBL fold metallo-hydrolase, partial [Thermomicrobiales bacterium]|nr:MBL fold metallo-hydrolase [Thermomicrobiales bacterium]